MSERFVILHGGQRRTVAKVSRPLPELAAALFASTQRAGANLAAARQFRIDDPSRLSAEAVAVAENEMAALAEAHGLVTSLIAAEAELRQRMPDVFADVAA